MKKMLIPQCNGCSVMAPSAFSMAPKQPHFGHVLPSPSLGEMKVVRHHFLSALMSSSEKTYIEIFITVHYPEREVCYCLLSD